jgi:hypothetical protein
MRPAVAAVIERDHKSVDYTERAHIIEQTLDRLVFRRLTERSLARIVRIADAATDLSLGHAGPYMVGYGQGERVYLLSAHGVVLLAGDGPISLWRELAEAIRRARGMPTGGRQRRERMAREAKLQAEHIKRINDGKRRKELQGLSQGLAECRAMVDLPDDDDEDKPEWTLIVGRPVWLKTAELKAEL